MPSASEPSRTSPAWPVLTGLATVTATIFRFVGIGKQSLWFDEGYTAWMVTHPPREILRLIRADTAPPLYYLLLRGWTDLFGYSEAALRSMSAVLSVLTLLLVIAVARRLLVKPAAVAAVAWLLVLGFQQDYYAQEARAYALMAFLLVAAFYCLLRHLDASHRLWLIPLALLCVASLYTHHMMAPYLLALAPVWLLLPSSHAFRRRVIDGALVAAATALLYLPWAIPSLPEQFRMVHQSFWVHRPELVDVLKIFDWIAGVPYYEDWNHFIYQLHSPHALGVAPAYIGPMILAIAAWLSIGMQRGPRRWQAIALLVLLLLPPLAVTIYSLVSRPLLVDKIFLPSAALIPVFLLLPMQMSLTPGQRTAVRCGVAALLAIGLFNYRIVPPKEQWREAARYVAEMPPHSRLIVFVANDGQLPFQYYYHLRPGESYAGAPSGFFDLNPPRTMLRVHTPSDADGLRKEIEQYHYDEVVFVVAHAGWGDPEWYTLAMLHQEFTIEQCRDFNLVSVYRLQR